MIHLEGGTGTSPAALVPRRTSFPAFAATYAEAIVQALPCADGNKRSGFLVAIVVLGLNGVRFDAFNERAVHKIQRLASGQLACSELEAWFVMHNASLR